MLPAFLRFLPGCATPGCARIDSPLFLGNHTPVMHGVNDVLGGQELE